MGYYSDVAFCMFEKDFRKMMSVFEKDAPETYRMFRNGGSYQFFDREADKVVVVKFEWVKWYDEFPEIAELNKYLDYCDEEGICYRLCKIGEDDYTSIRDDGSYELAEYLSIEVQFYSSVYGVPSIDGEAYESLFPEQTLNIDEMI